MVRVMFHLVVTTTLYTFPDMQQYLNNDGDCLGILDTRRNYGQLADHEEINDIDQGHGEHMIKKNMNC